MSTTGEPTPAEAYRAAVTAEETQAAGGAAFRVADLLRRLGEAHAEITKLGVTVTKLTRLAAAHRLARDAAVRELRRREVALAAVGALLDRAPTEVVSVRMVRDAMQLPPKAPKTHPKEKP